MKRKDHLTELRQKTVSALRVAAREVKHDRSKKLERARILTVIREKELTEHE